MKETNLEKAIDALKTIVDETLGEGEPVVAEDDNKDKKKGKKSNDSISSFCHKLPKC